MPKLSDLLKNTEISLKFFHNVNYVLRCLSDPTLCVHGYFVSMWLKLDRQMYDPHRTRYILASGGETSEIATAGVAVVMRHGVLWVEIRTRRPNRKFIYANQISIPQNTWFYLAIVWRMYYSDLEVYINNANTTVESASFQPASNQVAAHMYIGRASHTTSTHYFGKFNVNSESQSGSWVLTLIQNTILRRSSIRKKSNCIISEIFGCKK